MNTNTQTPRTDAAEHRDITGLGVVPVDFARQLERELQQATQELLDADRGADKRLKRMLEAEEKVRVQYEQLSTLRAEAATPSTDAEALIASCIPGGSICDPQQVADSIREYLHQQEPCGGRCGDPECDLDTMGVTMRTPAPHADTVRGGNTHE